MTERKVTVAIPDEAETFSDGVEDWVLDSLQRHNYPGVASESFAIADWTDEAVVD